MRICIRIVKIKGIFDVCLIFLDWDVMSLASPGLVVVLGRSEVLLLILALWCRHESNVVLVGFVFYGVILSA